MSEQQQENQTLEEFLGEHPEITMRGERDYRSQSIRLVIEYPLGEPVYLPGDVDAHVEGDRYENFLGLRDYLDCLPFQTENPYEGFLEYLLDMDYIPTRDQHLDPYGQVKKGHAYLDRSVELLPLYREVLGVAQWFYQSLALARDLEQSWGKDLFDAFMEAER